MYKGTVSVTAGRDHLFHGVVYRWSLILVEHVPAVVPKVLAGLAVHRHQLRPPPHLHIMTGIRISCDQYCGSVSFDTNPDPGKKKYMVAVTLQGKYVKFYFKSANFPSFTRIFKNTFH